MVKYQQTLKQMLEAEKEIFADFKDIHDKFMKDPKTFKSDFDQIGLDVQDIIRRYENILCGKSENGGYGKFSSNLSEKFHAEIKKLFPKIDHIGLEIV